MRRVADTRSARGAPGDGWSVRSPLMPEESTGPPNPEQAPAEPESTDSVTSASPLDDFSLLDTHPNVPRRGPVYLAFGLVVVAGVLGGLIGSSLVSATCSTTPPLLQRVLNGIEPLVGAPRRSCTPQQFTGTLGGALIAALGTAVVAVLVLRAMAEWRRTPPTTR
jgi:hypothetical protein